MLYYYFYIFHLMLIKSSKGVQQNFVQSNFVDKLPSDGSNTMFGRIGSLLKKPLKDLPHLDLQLREHNFDQDIHNSYIQWFLTQQSKLPITISTYEYKRLPISNGSRSHHKGNMTTRNNYVIVTDMDNIWLSVHQFVQSAGVLFFVIEERLDLKILCDIFNHMWINFLVYKNILLTKNGVYIYDPFKLNTFGEYGEVIPYNGMFSIEQTVFRNLRGYPLRVQMFQSVFSQPVIDLETNKITNVKGVDGKVAYLMENQLNFTMMLQDPDPNYFGSRFPNGTYNGAIGAIINNELDICFTGFFVKDYLTSDIEFSVAVYDDKLCVYTPKAKKIPPFFIPIYSLGYKIWLSFILMGFLSALIWTIIRRVNIKLNISHIDYKRRTRLLKTSLFNQFGDILAKTWTAWVRDVLVEMPPFKSEKLFVASISLTSVIFGSIVESTLSTDFIYPVYFKDINNLKELDESGLPIVYKYISMRDDLFFSETSPLFASLQKKLVLQDDFQFDILRDIAFKGGYAGVNRYNGLTMEAFDLIFTKRIWLIPDCPKYYAISYVWPKNAPWQETFNRLLLNIICAGLIQKFIRDMNNEIDIKVMIEQLYENNAGFKVLAVSDLQLAFVVLVFGNIFAGIVFIIEKLLKKLNKCQLL